jgi:hypothetical protein
MKHGNDAYRSADEDIDDCGRAWEMEAEHVNSHTERGGSHVDSLLRRLSAMGPAAAVQWFQWQHPPEHRHTGQHPQQLLYRSIAVLTATTRI